ASRDRIGTSVGRAWHNDASARPRLDQQVSATSWRVKGRVAEPTSVYAPAAARSAAMRGGRHKRNVVVADRVFDGAMQVMITKSEARNLLCEYIATIDRGKLREWPNFFAETCVYRIATRENEERGLPLSIMLCNRLKARGGAGIVTDGGYCDTHEVASLGFPA